MAFWKWNYHNETGYNKAIYAYFWRFWSNV
nr:MAG TPA: hypothetical protein [Caudoviricetes sp.]